jgi:carboxyl-terminal processing protease
MQIHSINRYLIDWNMMRSEAYTLADGAQTPRDTYNAIRIVLANLGDRHSFFAPPAEFTPPAGGEPMETPSLPSGELLENRIGYVSLPGFSGTDEAADKYAVAAWQSIAEIDTARPCGWIVDLRQNTGGNMWPMLAGIGPLLGEGHVGAFVYPDGQQQLWYYANGQARLDQELMFAVSAESSQHLAQSMPPIAVLTGHYTASSAEAIVVTFRGRQRTRSFGEETAGRSTSNQGFKLSDGAIIVLTVATFADRAGQTYGSKVVPDQVVERGTKSDDYVIKAAIEWLLKQPACIGKS